MSKLLSILIAVMLAGIAAPATAVPISRDFVVCTPGAVNACVSIQVQTSTWACNVPHVSPGSDCETVGQGALLTVNVRNLQGSIEQDNSNVFSFEGFGLILADGVNIGHSYGDPFWGWYGSSIVSPVGGSAGQFRGEITPNVIGAFSEFLGGAVSHVWGCATVDNIFWGVGGIQTCDPLGYTGYESYVSRFDNLFSANDIASVGIYGAAFAYATGDPFENPPHGLACGITGPSMGVNPIACTVVVPEPATLALLGLGLTGLGFARRKQTS